MNILSAMVYRFCFRSTSKRWFLENNPSDHKTWSIRSDVGIHVDFTSILHSHTLLVPQVSYEINTVCLYTHNYDIPWFHSLLHNMCDLHKHDLCLYNPWSRMRFCFWATNCRHQASIVVLGRANVMLLILGGPSYHRVGNTKSQ